MLTRAEHTPAGTLRRYAERVRKSTLTRPTLAFTAASFLEKGLLLAAVPVFTRLMTPTEYGLAAVFLTWAAVFRTTLNGNVHSSVVRAMFDHTPETFPRFFSSVVFLGALLGFAAVLVAAALPDPWLELAGLPARYVRLAVFAAAGWSAVLMWQNYWKGKYYYVPYLVVTLGLALLQTGGSALLMKFGIAPGHEGRIWGVMAPAVVIGGVLLAAAMRAGKSAYNPAAWKYALVFSLPLVPHTISGLLLSQFDRVLIARYNSPDEAGVYSLAYNFGEVMSVVWVALNSVWVPWFFARMKGDDVALVRRRSLQYTAGFFALSLGAMTLMPLAVHFVAPEGFSRAARIIPLIVASGFFQFLYGFYANVSFYHKRTAFVTLGTFSAAAVNVGLNLWLLPVYGFEAAAWTTLASYGLLFLFHATIVRVMNWNPGLFSFRWLSAAGAAATAAAVVMYAHVFG